MSPTLRSIAPRIFPRPIIAWILGLSVVFLSALVPVTAVAADGWKTTSVESGVTVQTRPGAGGNLPEFRGIIVVPSRIWKVLAVIEDLNSVCEWTKRCVANKELRRDSFTRRVFYNRTSAPWPFSDRDSVMLGEVSGLAAGKDVRMRFRRIQTKLMPPVAGVVRMPAMRGLYRVIALGPHRSKVIFQLRAHPGGSIPDWLAAWVSKRIPTDTLVGLRKQVQRVGGRYDAFLDKWDPLRRKANGLAAETTATGG